MQVTVTPPWNTESEPPLRHALADLDRALEGQAGTDEDALKAIGAELWRLAGLAAKTIADGLEEALDEEDPLQLIIAGGEAQQLPWELLYDADPRIGFLSRHDWGTLARRLHGKGTKAPTRAPRPLRLLLCVAAPEDLDPERARLDFEHEEELLYSALDADIARGELVLDVTEDGTLATLVARLERSRYHAVILSMHGAEAKNADGADEWGLLFEDAATGQRAPVAGTVLAARLQDLPSGHRPGLLVLAACRTAHSGEVTGQAIPSVAQVLHRSGFERVLGMRLSMNDHALSVFDAELFRRLVLGFDLGRAVSLARKRMAAEGWSGATRDAAGQVKGDPNAQWTLPVLMERTAGGPLLDRDAPAELIPREPPPTALNGDGQIALPEHGAFIGRRAILRAHLRPFLEGQTRRLLFTGPGGVGKTALAGWFARQLIERAPLSGSQWRILGFRAPFALDPRFIEVLRCEAFNGELGATDEETLREALNAEPQVRERVRRLLLSLATRPRPLCLVLDNLETLQETATLAFRAEQAESHWLLETALDLPAPTRVLLTGRYAIDGMAIDAACAVRDAPYGDVLRRLNRLDWPAGLGLAVKRSLYQQLGGNHRAIEWLARLLAERVADAAGARDLLDALAAQAVPPDTPEAAAAVVLEAMRQNLLFTELRAQLTPTQDWLLRAATHYRVPVAEEGFRIITHIAQADDTLKVDLDRLLGYALLEPSRTEATGIEYCQVPPIVRELIGEDRQFPPDEQARLHAAMGRYHRSQGEYVTYAWADDLEAIYHFRAAGDHEEADALAAPLANSYISGGAIAECSELVAPILARETPPAPWWALTYYASCALVLGEPDTALETSGNALALAPDERARGANRLMISKIYEQWGDYAQAVAYLERNLEISRKIGDRGMEGAALNGIGQIHQARGDNDEALDHYQQALEIEQDIGNRNMQGGILSNIGLVHQARADYDEALNCFEQSLKIVSEIGDRQKMGMILNNIGLVQQSRGDYDDALNCFGQSLDAMSEIGDRRTVCTTLQNIGLVHHSRGHLDQALGCFERALVGARAIGERRLESVLLDNIGRVHQVRGDYGQALDLFQQSLEMQRAIGARTLEGATLVNIGSIHQARGQYEQALPCFELALEIVREIGDRAVEGSTLNSIGMVHQARGDFDQALVCFEQALAVVRIIGVHAVECQVLNNMGLIHQTCGNFDEALACFEQALEVVRAIGDRATEGVILNNIGLVHQSRSDYEKALDCFEQALDIERSIGNRAVEGTTLNNIGMVHDARGDYESALAFFQQGLDIVRAVGDRRMEGTILNNIGGIHRVREEYDRALESFQQSLAIAQAIGDRRAVGLGLNNLGLILDGRGDCDQALELFKQSLEIARDCNDRPSEFGVLSNIGTLYFGREDYAQAQTYLEQSCEIVRAIGDRSGLTATLHNLAQIAFWTGDPVLALERWQEALTLAQETGNMLQLFSVARGMGQAFAILEQPESARQLLTLAIDVGRRSNLPGVSQLEEALAALGPAENDANE